ncbi:hypothetical protein [Thalassobacillus sp. C254]|uniref:hypothetical protein n=1 Tax=Thalassobacillus sp. C254 TaxID=1225341 RepID=UPI0006CF6BF8|nr:hypothetical protein [Thalassobacillus sp. C254]
MKNESWEVMREIRKYFLLEEVRLKITDDYRSGWIVKTKQGGEVLYFWYPSKTVLIKKLSNQIKL